jgi:hypothetical protein
VDDPHSSPVTQRVVGIGRILGAGGTFLIAVLGAVTGTIAWLDTRDPDIDLDASARAGVSLVSDRIVPEDVTVAVVNKSSRGLSLVEGKVQLAGASVGDVVAAASEPGATSDRASALPTLLPRTIPSEGTSRLRLQWRPVSARGRDLMKEARRSPENRRLTLRLRFEPGGWEQATVHVGSSPRALGGWSPLVTIADKRLIGMGLQVDDPGSGPALATLRVWPQNSGTRDAVFTSSRPVAWGLPAFFPLPRLAPGTYLYSLAAEDQTVGAGSVRTPCAGTDGSYSAGICVDGDATDASPLYR